MKKIFALILAICCLLSMIACGGFSGEAKEQLEAAITMLEETVPTKVVSTTTQTFGKTKLVAVATLTTGTIGGVAAATFVNNYQVFEDVDSGNYDEVRDVQETMWYVEGKGVSTNKGQSWDAEAANFAPTAGFIGLNLDEKYIESAEYDSATGALTIKISEENVGAVLKSYLAEGEVIESDVYITIVSAGGRISSISLEYYIPEGEIYLDEEETEYIEVGELSVVITAVYTYDTQRITME
jgi:hypothetical protein